MIEQAMGSMGRRSSGGVTTATPYTLSSVDKLNPATYSEFVNRTVMTKRGRRRRARVLWPSDSVAIPMREELAVIADHREWDGTSPTDQSHRAA
jgi:hypothetical protein